MSDGHAGVRAAFLGGIAISWVLLCAGCATSTGPAPPDLSEPQSELERRLDSLRETDETIRRQLDQLDDHRRDVEAASGQLAGADIPLALLRLVAMDCLNTEYDGSDSTRIDLGDVTLRCRAAHVELLRDALSEQPDENRRIAQQLLYHTDRARRFRGRIRRRLAGLNDDLSEGRDFIADQRAVLRQLDDEIEQRRNQYSDTARREARDHLQQHRRRLDELQQRLDELETTRPEWAQRANTAIASVYFALSRMRRLPGNSARTDP